MTKDDVIEQAVGHLTQRREELKRSIAGHQEALKVDSKELAKVEQALVGLKPLGHQTFLEKAGPKLLTAGAVTLGLFAAWSGGQSGTSTSIPVADLVLAVLHEGGQMTDAEIIERMEELGWTSNSENRLGLIRSYLSRLVQQGVVVRVGTSTYERAVDSSLTEVGYIGPPTPQTDDGEGEEKNERSSDGKQPTGG